MKCFDGFLKEESSLYTVRSAFVQHNITEFYTLKAVLHIRGIKIRARHDALDGCFGHKDLK